MKILSFFLIVCGCITALPLSIISYLLTLELSSIYFYSLAGGAILIGSGMCFLMAFVFIEYRASSECEKRGTGALDRQILRNQFSNIMWQIKTT
jgi:hypothetical protein